MFSFRETKHSKSHSYEIMQPEFNLIWHRMPGQYSPHYIKKMNKIKNQINENHRHYLWTQPLYGSDNVQGLKTIFYNGISPSVMN